MRRLLLLLPATLSFVGRPSPVQPPCSVSRPRAAPLRALATSIEFAEDAPMPEEPSEEPRARSTERSRRMPPEMESDDALLATLSSGSDSNWYSSSLATRKLLTADEEKLHGRAVQRMMRLLDERKALEDEVGRRVSLVEWAEHTNLSTDELEEAMSSYATSRRVLVEANLRLVSKVAGTYSSKNQYLHHSDLTQDGTLGLLKAVQRYDPELGYRFSTYAIHSIRQAVHKSRLMATTLLRLPPSWHTQISNIRKKFVELSADLGREPSQPELAAALDIPVSRIEELRKAEIAATGTSASSLQSLKYGTGEKQEAKIDSLQSDAPMPHDELESADGKAFASAAIEHAFEKSGLTDRERRVLVLMYAVRTADDNLDGYEEEEPGLGPGRLRRLDGSGLPRTSKEIARELGLSSARIRQLHQAAMKKLRTSAYSSLLRDALVLYFDGEDEAARVASERQRSSDPHRHRPGRKAGPRFDEAEERQAPRAPWRGGMWDDENQADFGV